MLCLCACAAASTALASPTSGSRGAKSASSHSVHHPSGRHRKRHCAKRSSFRTSGGHSHRSKRHPGCRKRHSKGFHHGSHKTKHHVTQHKLPASHSSSCPDADLRPGPDNLDAVRNATLCLINRERTSHGENTLTADGDLQQAAQSHSEDMAAGNYFEHIGRHGDTPLGRMRSAGYIFSSRLGFEVGENIGWGTLWLASPRAMVASWMASPGHRENILDAHFRDTGIGISPHPLSSLAKGQAGAIYTQDFGVIINP